VEIPVLRTGRFELLPPSEDHLGDLVRIQDDPRVARWYGAPPDPPHDPARQREEVWRQIALHLGHWRLRGFGHWAVVDRSTRALVGRVGLWEPEGWPGVEVGWMVDPDRWGQGIATEAGRAALDHAFAQVLDRRTRQPLDEVVSVTLPENVASRRVMEKLGLTDTGRTVELRGHTQVLYRITRAEWTADARDG
jgi:RimJ/RimL family protein N-acetyltransferase